jgi:SAM-dependent methyltransferase
MSEFNTWTDEQFVDFVLKGLRVTYDSKLGHHRLDPYPNTADVEDYYKNDNFYKTHSPPDWFKKEISEYKEGLWDSHFKYLCNIMYRNSHFDTSCRRVDWGCGGGLFVDFWQGYGGRVFGIEPSEMGRSLAKLNSPATILSSEKQLPFDQFCFISLQLVLEHIPYPVDFLRHVSSYLREGGLLLVTVPNDFNPLQRRLNYTGFISPVHVNYFTPDTLRGVMEAAGLKVIHQSATFPMELFPLTGINYIGNDQLGRRCHMLRLRLEKLFGWRIFNLYKKLYDRWGIGRELIFVGEK